MKKFIKKFIWVLLIFESIHSSGQPISYTKKQTRDLIHDSLENIRQGGIYDSTKMATKYDLDTLVDNGVRGVLYSEIMTMAGGGFDSTQMIVTGYLQNVIGISRGFIVDTVCMVGIGSAVDVDVKLWHGTSLASGTAIDNTAFTVNSVTTGNKWSSGFESATIPDGSWIWATITEATTKCRRIAIIIKGHRL